VTEPVNREVIVVAGTNGAGKSTILNELLLTRGVTVLNPDQIAKVEIDQGASPSEANSRAWHTNVGKLEDVRDHGGNFAFETTLGGRTITRLLQEIVARGGTVRIYYIGLESADLHVKRVEERVKRGGHAIPEERIRARYSSSLEHLARLMREVRTVRIYDNTAEPRHVASIAAGKLTEVTDRCPEWARGVIVRAFGSERSRLDSLDRTPALRDEVLDRLEQAHAADEPPDDPWQAS
jgi:predicted ABC-type ATPase